MGSFAQYFPGDLNDVIFSRQRLRRPEGRLALPGSVTTGWLTVAKLRLPTSDHGYLTAYSNEVIDPSWDYNGGIQFRILVNETPVDDCDTFSEFRGSIPNPADAFYYIKPNATITFQARRNIAGSARDVVMGGVIQTWPQVLSSSFAESASENSGARRRLR